MSKTKYRNWVIEHNPKPIPNHRHDWDVTHEEYDGPEDGRHFTAESLDDAKNQVDEYYNEGGDEEYHNLKQLLSSKPVIIVEN